MNISNFKRWLENISKSRLTSLTLITIALVLPTFSKQFTIGLPILFVWATFAISYDIILGFCGIPSFGHAAPFGLGAFTAAILLSHSYPLIVAILAGAIVGMIVNASMSLPCYRVKGIYYAILTLAIAEMIHVLISNIAKTTVAITVGTTPELISNISPWIFAILMIFLWLFSTYAYVKDIKNTRYGRVKTIKILVFAAYNLIILYGAYRYFENILLTLLWRRNIPYIELVRILIPLNRYYYTFTLMLLSYTFLYRVARSPLGTIFIAIRENPERAEVIGYNVFKYTVLSFAISGFVAGISGASYMICISTAPLEVLTVDKTFIALLGSVIGGLGTLIGPLFGGMLVGLLRDYLSKIVPSIHALFPVLTVQQLQLLPSAILGVIYIVIVMLLPYGIFGTWYLKGTGVKRKIKMILTGRKWH